MPLQNQCIFMGRLVKDPEVSQINGQNGPITKTRISIAVDKGFQKGGQQKESTFVNLSAIGARADFIAKYFSKGKPIYVTAEYTTYKSERNGQTTYGHDFNITDATFVVADYSDKSNQNAGASNNYSSNNSYNKPANTQPDFKPNEAFGGDFLADVEEFPF